MKNVIQMGIAITTSLIAWGSMIVGANAATVQLDGNSVTKIKDLEIGNNLYDVSFVNDLAENVGNKLLIQGADPLDATVKITDFLNTLNPIPTLTAGSNYFYVASFFYPIERSGYSNSLVYGSNYAPDEQNWSLSYRTGSGLVTPIFEQAPVTYATFAAVPEPSDILVSITAVGLFIVMKRTTKSSQKVKVS